MAGKKEGKEGVTEKARMLGVTTGRLNEQVRRNEARFPEDFRIRVSKDEEKSIIANCDIDLAELPYRLSPRPRFAYTKRGAVMAAALFKGPQAAKVAVIAIRALCA